MRSFIALSGNLTRATIEAGDESIPVIGLTFQVLDDEPVEILVEEPSLIQWLEASLAVLTADDTLQSEMEDGYDADQDL